MLPCLVVRTPKTAATLVESSNSKNAAFFDHALQAEEGTNVVSKSWISAFAPTENFESIVVRDDFLGNLQDMATIAMSGDIQRVVGMGSVGSVLSTITELGPELEINCCYDHHYASRCDVLFCADLAHHVGLGHNRHRDRSLGEGRLLRIMA